MFSCVVLCGGSSERMGRNKAFIKIGGIRIIDGIVTQLKKLSKNIVLVVDKKEKYAQIGRYENVEVLEDEKKNFGPIEGMRIGLKKVYNKNVFICACDMPLLNFNCVRELYKHTGENTDCVIPKTGGRMHPLHGFYKRDIYGFLDWMSCSNIRKVKYLVENVRSEFVEEFNCNMKESVTNLNYPEDAENLIKKGVLYGQ